MIFPHFGILIDCVIFLVNILIKYISEIKKLRLWNGMNNNWCGGDGDNGNNDWCGDVTDNVNGGVDDGNAYNNCDGNGHDDNHDSTNDCDVCIVDGGSNVGDDNDNDNIMIMIMMIMIVMMLIMMVILVMMKNMMVIMMMVKMMMMM